MEEDKKEEIKIVKVTEELIKAKTYEITVNVSHQILHLNLPRKRLTT